MKHLLALLILVGVSALGLASAGTPNATSSYSLLDGRLPGVGLAQGISEITGVAISPLLGVSSIGAWRYFQASASEREHLPWFCHPVAWGLAFLILGLCLLKDLAGTIIPAVLKKPFDMLELFEDKLSALVASGAFVPLVAMEMARRSQYLSAHSEPTAALHLAGMPFLPLAEIPWTAGLAIPVALAGFFVVWLAAHGINVLIALSPFAIVDATLKLLKTALLSSVVAAAFLSPVLSLLLCGTIIFIAALLAPWAFRLSVFGTLFGWDILTFRKTQGEFTHVRACTAGRFAGLPARTFGRIEPSADGSIWFVYRPWLLLPRRRIPLPSQSLTLSRGILYPTLLQCDSESQRLRGVLAVLPRYRSRTDEFAVFLGITAVQDGFVVRGFRAFRLWAAEMLNLGRRPVAPVCGS